MIIKNIESLIEKEKRRGEFIYPFYEKYCFSNIPSTILNFFNIKTKRPTLPPELYKKLGIKESDKVVLFLIDGFGYTQWMKYYKNYDFFYVFTKRGNVSPLTAIFPSTTAAALTTINTGLTPQEHALPEWVVYFKEIDMIIDTLPFRAFGMTGQDSLLEMGINPKILYNGNSIYQTLKKEGVKTFTFINESYANSAYSKLVYKGSTIVPFVNYSDMIVNLRKYLEKEEGPSYFYVYLGSLDSMGHKYGPYTNQYYTELSTLSFLLKKELLEKIDQKTAEETIVIMTSDHGQINVSPKETIYLNEYRKLLNNFKKSKKSKSIFPTGSPRDIFLHIKPNKLEETYRLLSKKIGKKAKIMKTEEAIKLGLFGLGKPKREFYDRIGDILILPYSNHTIWYEHLKGKKFDLLGHHGGLSKEEMLVPFAIARLSELK